MSVYEEDDEAFAIWHNEIGLAAKRHLPLRPARQLLAGRRAEATGPNGLCGPCSEIFYDWGPQVGCGKPDCQPSCDCAPLLRGLEPGLPAVRAPGRRRARAAAAQEHRHRHGPGAHGRGDAGRRSRISTPTCSSPIIAAIEQETDQRYAAVRDTRQGVAFRRIADHVRAATFCIGDGVLPGNTGRGYVLRKIIRRAVLDGSRLGRKDAFALPPRPGDRADVMGDQYPEIVERRENIARLIRIEEERFQKTLEQGRGILDGLVEQLQDLRRGRACPATRHSACSTPTACRST